jgi:hypothetical protein
LARIALMSGFPTFPSTSPMNPLHSIGRGPGVPGMPQNGTADSFASGESSSPGAVAASPHVMIVTPIGHHGTPHHVVPLNHVHRVHPKR